jgi:folate-binding protein YgfZ
MNAIAYTAGNPPLATNTLGLLPHLGVLDFAGPDALTFLQGQVSNDTRRLGSGSSLLAAYSTPQGRVLCVMHLLPHAGGARALLPRELVAPTRERLQKFVLRSKVELRDLSAELVVAGLQNGDAATMLQAGLDHWPVRTSSGRQWVVGSAQQVATAGSRESLHTPTIENAWRLADIREGLPQVYAANSETFVAQMLNLDLIDGISFNKGCYTGQEIIARTQHLGRIKRRMHRLRLPPGDWAIGQNLTLADGRSGRLTELADAGGHMEALAVLTADAGDGEPMAAVELPLPYALTAV